MTVRVKVEVRPDWWLPRSAHKERPQGSRDTAEKVVPAGRGRVVRSSDFLRAPERQTPDAIDRIHRAIREGAERFMRDGAYEVAWPAVLAAARKPHS